MKPLNPIELLLWTFRRNERDVVNLYDYLAGVMTLATGGSMLNFGYWDGTDSPVQAQQNLCELFGRMADLRPGQRIADVGSGYGSPAYGWLHTYDPIDIACVNINVQQLAGSDGMLDRTAATATRLPFHDGTMDRVLALESAQHFKPLDAFISESYRVLRDGGLLALAVPVMTERSPARLARLGLLSVTWSSQHYTVREIVSAVERRFTILERREIGSSVYDPLADYYTSHRGEIRDRITSRYPGFVEGVLFRSIGRMRSVSQDKTIGYMMVTCRKKEN